MSSESILEKLPVFDGSLRRKFIVGALVLLSIILSYPSTPAWIGIIQQSNGLWGSSLLTVIFFLLVYAVGGAVELLGEVSIVRAISGALWGVKLCVRSPFRDSWFGFERKNFVHRWSYRYMVKPFLLGLVGLIQIVIGIFVLAPCYFAAGVFGRSVYRIAIGDFLSKDGKAVLDTFPIPIQEGLNDPIGGMSDLVFVYLVESFRNEAYRNWAKSLVARCKDVLALATSALVIVVFFGIVSVYPFYNNYEAWRVQQLSSANQQITNIDIHFARLIPIIANEVGQLFQHACRTKESDSEYCKGLQGRLMRISDLGSQSGRAMFFWGVPTMQFIENNLSLSDLKNVSNVIHQLEYGRDTLFHQIAVREFRQNETGRTAAEEIIKRSHETIEALKIIEAAHREAEDKYYRWFSYTVLALIFSVFMYFGFRITIKNTLVSLIEGLAVQAKA